MFSRVVEFAARLAHKTANYTHVAVSVPAIDTNGLTFHYELGQTNWANEPSEPWWLYHEYIDLDLGDHVTPDDVLNRLWGLAHNNRGTTLLGLLSLFYGWQRRKGAAVCTDVPWIACGILPSEVPLLTPDELLVTLKYPPIVEES